MIQRFRKKPVEIEAVRFAGGNTVEVCQFMADGGGGYRTTTHPTDASQDEIFIQTLGGEMRAVDGDWVVKGVASEFYPVKPGIFEATYEAAS